jgi:hypothetical protein
MTKFRVQIRRKQRREPMINRDIAATSHDDALNKGIAKGIAELYDFTPHTARVTELGGRNVPREANVIASGKDYRFEWVVVTTPKAA